MWPNMWYCCFGWKHDYCYRYRQCVTGIQPLLGHHPVVLHWPRRAIVPYYILPRFKHSHMFSNFRKLAPIRRPSVVTSLPDVVTNPTDSLTWDHELDFILSAPWEEGRLLLEPLCESVSEISEFLRSTNVASRSEMPNWIKGLKFGF